MQNKSFTHIAFATAAMLLFCNVAKAQQLSIPQLEPSQTQAFLNSATYQPVAVPSILKMPGATFPAKQTESQSSEEILSRMMEENHITHFTKTPAYMPQAEEQEHPLTFIGMCQVAFITADRFYTPYGLYKFSTKNGLVREQYADVNACINLGNSYSNNELHGYSSIPLPYTAQSDDGSIYFYEWDTDTWLPCENSGTQKIVDDLMGEQAYDPVTKKTYGFNFSGTYDPQYYFETIDYASQTVQVLGNCNSVVKCFAINAQGEAYALCKDKVLYKVNLTDGSMTEVGPLDVVVYFALQSMTFDDRTGKLYLCISSQASDGGMTSGIYEVSTEDAHCRLIGNLPEGEEYTCLRVLYEPEDGCPASIEDLKMAFEGPATSGNVTFTMPSQNVGGETMSGSIDYTLEIDNADYTTGSAAAGTNVSIPVSFETLGLHKAVVILKNATGEGVRNVATAYVGNDTPMVHELTSTLNADGDVTLTWTANVGEYGGYVDVANQTFNVVRYPDLTVVATGITDCTVTDALSTIPYNGYSYEVTAVVGETTGKAVRSDVIKAGVPYTVPYTEPINSEEDLSKFDIVDANGDGSTWATIDIEEYDGSYNTRLYYHYNTENDADDWAILPPVHLEAGNVYQLSFKAAGVNADRYEEILAAGYGLTADPASFTTLMEPTILTGSIRAMETYNLTLSITESGDYRFGLHALSKKAENAIFVDDLSVTLTASLHAPQPVTDLVVTPGEEGELVATAQFTAPSNDFAGDALTSIAHIDLIRNGEEVAASAADVTPGSQVTLTDNDAVNGFATYYVIAYNEFGASTADSATIYVGEDAPLEPTDVLLSDNCDGTLQLQWSAPSATGANGGYVDSEALTYVIYGVNESQSAFEEIKEVEGTSCTIENVDQSGEQALAYYAVQAKNELGESEQVQACIYTGVPYNLPFADNFANGWVSHSWYYDCNDYKGGFNMYSGMSADGDNYVAAYQPYTLGTTSSLHSGKIALGNAKNPHLVFAFYNMPGCDNSLAVTIRPNGQAASDTLFFRNFAENSEPAGWNYVSYDLSAYKETNYLLLTFTAYVNDKNTDIVIIDDINILDQNEKDLSASLSAQTHATQGDVVTLLTAVRNTGSLDAEGYHVNFYMNNEMVGSVEGEKLQSFESKTYSFDYQTTFATAEQSVAHAEVVFEGDQNPDNNVSDDVQMSIVAPLLNRVNDLAAVADGANVNLSWSEVCTNHDVTDSFEGYKSFITEGFGDWKTYDGDGMQTYGISGLSFDHAGEAYAWITFDFGAAGLDLSLNPDYYGKTGSQMLVSARCYNKNNDWVISPELSGEAQTITFYLRTVGSYFGDKAVVYTSSATDAIADFTYEACVYELMDDTQFLKCTVDLPEGTKYFAIVNNGWFGGFLQLDDVSYVGAPLTLKGYNVYRDGSLIGTTETPAYSDVLTDAASHVYNVTAIFVEGESGFSNSADVITGISNVNRDSQSDDNCYDLMGRHLSRPVTGMSIRISEDGNVSKVYSK